MVRGAAAVAVTLHLHAPAAWARSTRVSRSVLATTLAARRVDSANFAGLTADGETATAAGIRTWSLNVSAFAVAGWLAGHLLAWFLS